MPKRPNHCRPLAYRAFWMQRFTLRIKIENLKRFSVCIPAHIHYIVEYSLCFDVIPIIFVGYVRFVCHLSLSLLFLLSLSLPFFFTSISFVIINIFLFSLFFPYRMHIYYFLCCVFLIPIPFSMVLVFLLLLLLLLTAAILAVVVVVFFSYKFSSHLMLYVCFFVFPPRTVWMRRSFISL